MDYKKYSLEQLENWMHDAMSAGEATPQEIYDVIIEVVKDNYYTYKKQASEAYELLALLNGNGGWSVEDVLKEKEYYEPSMPPWGHSDLEYMIHNKEHLSCDKDDTSPECKGAWNDFWQQVDEDVKENLQNEGYDWTPVGSKDGYPLYVNQKGDFSIPDYVTKNDKVVKWQLPVQVDGLSGDCFVEFPDDLLEAANLKEGDTVEWVDKGNGSYILRKVNVRP
jgi:hypothetical protein